MFAIVGPVLQWLLMSMYPRPIVNKQVDETNGLRNLGVLAGFLHEKENVHFNIYL